MLYATPVEAKPSHALVLYGEPKYLAGFTYTDYVNPSAPRGGLLKQAEMGNFDSLNPFILKGVKAPGIGIVYDSLMKSSYDEPQTYYGLIAKTVNVAEDGMSVSFTLRPEARWHDGEPITVEDVVFTLEALKEKGDPAYRIMLAPIERAEKTGPRTVKYSFSDATNRELPLIVAGLPVLPKHYYNTHDFGKATLDPPLTSGPYRVEKVDPNRSITYHRVTDYWADMLPINRGLNNFDRIRYDMYLDENSSLLAFLSGEYDFRREYIARNWATSYESPAIKDGRIIKRRVEHDIPQGMQAFLINTRQSRFKDRRVREALDLTMDFQWLNKTIFYGEYIRNDSFFGSTPFAATESLPKDEELALLEKYREQLPAGLFSEKPTVPETDGSGNSRPNLIKAQELLEAAGWIIRDGVRVNAETGEQLTVAFMLRQPTMERVIAPMRKSMEKLGIRSSIRRVDDAQYQKRIDTRDFDVISIWLNRGIFFPGNEQMALWHSSQADVEGSNNIAGVSHPAVDEALIRLIAAKDLDALKVAGRALDRVLLWEHYVIPHWRSQNFRIAYWDKFGQPKVTPEYDLGIDTWWIKQ